MGGLGCWLFAVAALNVVVVARSRSRCWRWRERRPSTEQEAGTLYYTVYDRPCSWYYTLVYIRVVRA